MPVAPFRLSKSKIAAFEHCPKRLWLQVHRRNEAKFDDATLARFQFGRDVGQRARFLVPDGALIETAFDMAAAIAETQALIDGGHRAPIFEATFQYENVLVRIDILQPAGDGWEVIEVKGSTRVGSHHLADIATQVWVALGCGLNVTKATIRHLAGWVDWRHPDIGGVTFQDTDVTTELDRFIRLRPACAAAASAAVEGPTPVRRMGSFCSRPLACEFRAYCSRARADRPDRRDPSQPL